MNKILSARNYRAGLLVQLSFWSAAVAVGVVGVYFAKLVGLIQDIYSSAFQAHPILSSVLTPFGILAGAAVIRLAPMAGGSGVPQVLHAAELARHGNTNPTEQKLVSARTAIVKVISTALGFFAGASIGIEGPMVQISTSIFAESANRVKRWLPNIDFQSYIVAGAGTGIAAAFNAPLGGIAFAVEEVATSTFGELRHLVLLAIIICGLTTHALGGNELYFGNPQLGAYELRFIAWAILIGVICGVLGGVFGKIVVSNRLRRIGGGWWQRALLFGALVALLGYFFNGQTAFNYRDTRALLTGNPIELPLLFPLGKLLATAFSTLSGLGGGILAPSLSIGAWIGVTTAKLAALSNIKACALLGMVAYFSGAFQIPITAVIVVMEITGQQEIIFPMMIAALTAHLVARLIMPVSLYHLLIQRTFFEKNPKLTAVASGAK
jgi:H+/Cl- antiporter ClcA